MTRRRKNAPSDDAATLSPSTPKAGPRVLKIKRAAEASSVVSSAMSKGPDLPADADGHIVIKSD